MHPGISLTFDDMTTLADNLSVVIEALTGINAITRLAAENSGDSDLAFVIHEFSDCWKNKRESLAAEVTNLQGLTAEIIDAMRDLDRSLAQSLGTPGCFVVADLPSWSSWSTQESSPGSPFPWEG